MAYLIWKLIKKTKWVHLKDVPLEEILLEIERNPEPEEKASRGWIRLISWLWD